MKMMKLSLGPLGTNCYITYKDKEALIFDPGGESNKIIDWLSDNNITPLAVCLTHAHFDHIGAVDEIRNYYKIPVYVNEKEEEWLGNPDLNGSGLFPVDSIQAEPADYFLKEGSLEIGPFLLDVIHTPGHSPGGVAFVSKPDEVIIGGDSLFREGVGRTDLPGGNLDHLIDSITTKIFPLGDTFTVYPGHGPETTVGHEKLFNPFLK